MSESKRFFYYGDDGRGTDPQHAGGIADPAAIEGHSNDLATDLRYSTSILVVEEKDSPRALPVLTLIALGPVALLARLTDLCSVIVRTLDGNVDHPCPPHIMIK